MTASPSYPSPTSTPAPANSTASSVPELPPRYQLLPWNHGTDYPFDAHLPLISGGTWETEDGWYVRQRIGTRILLLLNAAVVSPLYLSNAWDYAAHRMAARGDCISDKENYPNFTMVKTEGPSFMDVIQYGDKYPSMIPLMLTTAEGLMQSFALADSDKDGKLSVVEARAAFRRQDDLFPAPPRWGHIGGTAETANDFYRGHLPQPPYDILDFPYMEPGSSAFKLFTWAKGTWGVLFPRHLTSILNRTLFLHQCRRRHNYSEEDVKGGEDVNNSFSECVSSELLRDEQITTNLFPELWAKLISLQPVYRYHLDSLPAHLTEENIPLIVENAFNSFALVPVTLELMATAGVASSLFEAGADTGNTTTARSARCQASECGLVLSQFEDLWTHLLSGGMGDVPRGDQRPVTQYYFNESTLFTYPGPGPSVSTAPHDPASTTGGGANQIDDTERMPFEKCFGSMTSICTLGVLGLGLPFTCAIVCTVAYLVRKKVMRPSIHRSDTI